MPAHTAQHCQCMHWTYRIEHGTWGYNKSDFKCNKAPDMMIYMMCCDSMKACIKLNTE